MDHRRGRLLVALVVACAAVLGWGPAGSVLSTPAPITGAGSGSATGSVPTGDHAPPASASTSQAAPRAGLPLSGADTWPFVTLPVAAWAAPAADDVDLVAGTRRTGVERVGVVGARAPPAGRHLVITGQRPPPLTA